MVANKKLRRLSILQKNAEMSCRPKQTKKPSYASGLGAQYARACGSYLTQSELRRALPNSYECFELKILAVSTAAPLATGRARSKQNQLSLARKARSSKRYVPGLKRLIIPGSHRRRLFGRLVRALTKNELFKIFKSNVTALSY